MKKLFLFCIVFILIVSLVPLSGVSAQRAAPAASANTAPAAQATYTKTIKTSLIVNCSGVKCLKYVQKITWEYDNSLIVSDDYEYKGVSYNSSWAYMHPRVVTMQGGPGLPYGFVWTEGTFLKGSTGMYILTHIAQFFFADGTWSSQKFFRKTDYS